MDVCELAFLYADIKVLLGMMVDTAALLLQLCLALGVQISGCVSCGCQSVEVASTGAALDHAPAYLGQLQPRNNTAVACNPPLSHRRSVPPSWGAQRGGAAGRLLPVRRGQGPHYRHLLSTLQVDRGRLSRELQRCHHEQVIRKILQYLS